MTLTAVCRKCLLIYLQKKPIPMHARTSGKRWPTRIYVCHDFGTWRGCTVFILVQKGKEWVVHVDVHGGLYLFARLYMVNRRV